MPESETEPTLDPIEALKAIRTIASVAQESDDKALLAVRRRRGAKSEPDDA